MKKKVKKKSNRKKLGGIIFCCLFFLSLISGCSSIPEYHYYFLDYEIPHNDNSNPKYNFSLGIERLQAEEIYKSDTIIFRNSPYEAKHYIYKLWGSNPRTLLSERTLEHIRASGLFESVRFYPGMYNADYILRGYI